MTWLIYPRIKMCIKIYCEHHLDIGFRLYQRIYFLSNNQLVPLMFNGGETYKIRQFCFSALLFTSKSLTTIIRQNDFDTVLCIGPISLQYKVPPFVSVSIYFNGMLIMVLILCTMPNTAKLGTLFKGLDDADSPTFCPLIYCNGFICMV